MGNTVPIVNRFVKRKSYCVRSKRSSAEVNPMKFSGVNYNKDRAEELTKRLLDNPRSQEADVLITDLLTEFHRGYPLENLRPLFFYEDEDVVVAGAWIASELGRKGKPLLSEISALL